HAAKTTLAKRSARVRRRFQATNASAQPASLRRATGKTGLAKSPSEKRTRGFPSATPRRRNMRVVRPSRSCRAQNRTKVVMGSEKDLTRNRRRRKWYSFQYFHVRGSATDEFYETYASPMAHAVPDRRLLLRAAGRELRAAG